MECIYLGLPLPEVLWDREMHTVAFCSPGTLVGLICSLILSILCKIIDIRSLLMGVSEMVAVCLGSRPRHQLEGKRVYNGFEGHCRVLRRAHVS